MNFLFLFLFRDHVVLEFLLKILEINLPLLLLRHYSFLFHGALDELHTDTLLSLVVGSRTRVKCGLLVTAGLALTPLGLGDTPIERRSSALGLIHFRLVVAWAQIAIRIVRRVA